MIELGFYNILWYFFIYSFIGWVIEVIYHVVTCGKVINRGFLNGPVCPVYGFGMIAALGTVNGIMSLFSTETGIALDGKIQSVIYFLAGLILATAVELIAGWALDVLFHTRWWDYSDRPFNFRGYICLGFSLIWGFAVDFAIEIAHPAIALSAKIPQKIGYPILAVVYIIFIVDTVVTASSIIGLNKKLKRIDEISASMREVSDSLSETIGENAMKTTQKLDETKVQLSLAKLELRNYINTHRHFGTGRLVRAFPHMKQRDYHEILEEAKKYLDSKLEKINENNS